MSDNDFDPEFDPEDVELNIIMPDDDEIAALTGENKDDTPKASGGLIMPDADDIAEFSDPGSIEKAAARLEEEAREMRADKLMRRKMGLPQADGTIIPPKQSLLSGENPEGLAWKHSNTKNHHQLEGIVLKGKVSESENSYRVPGQKTVEKGTAFTLSVEVDYKQLWTRNDEKRADAESEDTFWLDYKQKRASSLTIGEFSSIEDAQNYLNDLEKMFLHVIAEQGAENTSIAESNDDVIFTADTEASKQTYSDALKTARTAHIFNKAAKGETLLHREALNYIDTIVRVTGVDCEIEAGAKKVRHNRDHRYDFGHDIGILTLINNGEQEPAGLQFEAYEPGALNTSERFNGAATGESLQTVFTNWVVDAAKERGTIDAETHSKLRGQVTEIAGVALQGGKLKAFSPF